MNQVGIWCYSRSSKTSLGKGKGMVYSVVVNYGVCGGCRLVKVGGTTRLVSSVGLVVSSGSMGGRWSHSYEWPVGWSVEPLV